MRHILRFKPGGGIECLYTEAINLHALGRLTVVRATDICFCEESQEWNVHCTVTGDLLLSDPSREACLVWERDHLQPGSTPDPTA